MTELVAPEESRPPASLAAALGWAVFLAVSWTWCIGMFLPVLLVRDYGPWAWVVFAVPNVIGAAAMGWALRDAAASRAMVERHRPAFLAFSIITAAFQWFFAGWLLGKLAALVFVAGALFVVAFFLSEGSARVAAVSVFGVSAAAFAYFTASGAAFDFTWAGNPAAGLTRSLWWVTPVSVFGFLLCPYLDLTFHRARQAAGPARGRLAFGVGFGVFFLAMILFTLAYAGAWSPVASGGPALGPERATAAVMVHMTLQLAFTIAVHVRECAAAPRPALGFWLSSLGAAAAGLLLAWAPWPEAQGAGPGEFSAHERVYRCFMAFYALVFPAHVWLCVVPGRGAGPARPTRRSLAVLAAAVAVASPMYWLGFIEGETIWLAPGLLVVLLARLAIPRAAGAGGPSPTPRVPDSAPPGVSR